MNACKTALRKLLWFPNSGKVFALGLGRTGTMSLNHLFRDIGYMSTHDFSWRFPKYSHLHYTMDCFTDCPIYPPEGDFQYFDKHFRKAKFILNVRDLDTWLTSRVNLYRKHIATDFSPASNAWNDHPETLANWIRSRNQYHIDVMRYFEGRPDDFLAINFITDDHAVQKICAFLDKPAPAVKPHGNNFSDRKNADAEEVAALVAEAMDLAGIALDERSNDLFCPSSANPEAVKGLPSTTAQILT